MAATPRSGWIARTRTRQFFRIPLQFWPLQFIRRVDTNGRPIEMETCTIVADGYSYCTPEEVLFRACKFNQDADIDTVLRETDVDINLTRAQDGASLLHMACFHISVDCIRLLLTRGANTDQLNKKHETPLHIACREGLTRYAQLRLVECVRLLLAHNANGNYIDNDGRTPLSIVCEHGNTVLAQLLLKHGVDVNIPDNLGRTPLLWACQKGHVDCVYFLLEHGAGVNYASTNDGTTPLHSTCKNGNLECTSLLLEHGADTEKVTRKGFTPLYLAGFNRHRHCIRLLLNNDANANHRMPGSNITPLMWTCKVGKVAYAHLLLNHGADTTHINSNGETALFIACFYGNTNCVRLLLEHSNETVNTPLNNGVTPLFITCQQGYTDCTRILLEYGANPNLTCNDETPLWKACRNGHTECARLVLSKSIETIHTPNNEGMSPFMTACHEGKMDCVRLLLEHNINLEQSDHKRRNAMHAVCVSGNVICLEMLLAKGMIINCVDKKGYTPLIYACQRGHPDCVSLLLEHDADVEMKTIQHDTALSIAAGEGHTECVDLLLRHGAIMHDFPPTHNPLRVACHNGKIDCVRLLLHEKPPTTGNIALVDAAVRQHHPAVVDILLESGRSTIEHEPPILPREPHCDGCRDPARELVTLAPCGHSCCCRDCLIGLLRWNRCFICQARVETIFDPEH